ncbi:leydig cell tumor 10 kDa protein homolog isoform X1 [Symphalangus syndactylus]|uniref:leydig cell tumor 10 kDa protein homolog isoform X1 n=1 Tax=Symphalangus syndactylus TaxID=9590 RepID=UPI003004A443
MFENSSCDPLPLWTAVSLTLCHVVSRELLRFSAPLYPMVPCAFRLRLLTAPPLPLCAGPWRRGSASSRRTNPQRARQQRRPLKRIGAQGKAVVLSLRRRRASCSSKSSKRCAGTRDGARRAASSEGWSPEDGVRRGVEPGGRT